MPHTFWCFPFSPQLALIHDVRLTNARSFSGKVNAGQSDRNWADVTSTIGAGIMRPNLILCKLAVHPRQNELAAALAAKTVTWNCCVATELSAPLAVTVMVVTPLATGLTVTSDPATPTVATPDADDDAW